MDLKDKIKQLINRQGSLKSPKSPEGQPVASYFESRVAASAVTEQDVAGSPTASIDNEPTDDDVLSSVEDLYYSDGAFDASDHVLQKLPEVLDLPSLNVDRNRLDRQLQVVSGKVSNLILQKQTSCVRELQTVYELQNNLKEALNICRGARGYLGDAMQQFTVASLGILSNYYKRQQLLGILKSLKMIKTLQQTDVRLRELLEEEDYPSAIDLCLTCQKAVLTFRHYKCISELSSKLQDTIEMIEEQLDVALSRVCSNFVTDNYEKLQRAYSLLGKTQTAMDQLHMHFTTAIHNTTFTIVLGYIKMNVVRADTSFHKLQYSELCKYVVTESFTACLLDLCKALWQIMRSYYRIMEWHEKNDYESNQVAAKSSAKTLGLEANFNRRYIRQKLEHGLLRVWQDLQQKVKAFLLGTDLSSFKFDEFIGVLDVVGRLIEIGEEFCGSKSDDLQESIRRQSANYFKNYHRSCMEELRMFLENEGWEACPVKNNFSVFHLMEFRFLDQSALSGAPSSGSGSSSMPSSPLRRIDGSPGTAPNSPQVLPVPGGFFQRYYDDDNPFNKSDASESNDRVDETNAGKTDSSEGNGQMYSNDLDDSDDSDIADELKRDYVDEQTGDKLPTLRHSRVSHNKTLKHAKGQAPILTNTTLNVLRLFGKYMQMMTVLHSCAFDVVICLSKLFEYYMYAVYIFFGTDLNAASELAILDRVKTTLNRIGDHLVCDESEMPSPIVEAAAGDNKLKLLQDRVPRPRPSPVVNLSDEETLYGLSERVVAAESLVFLAGQLKLLQSSLEALVPQSKRAFLQQFYTYAVGVAPDLRSPIYIGVAARAVDYERVLTSMAGGKWDIVEIMSQHNPYVDILLRDMQVFSMRLTDVCKRVAIPREAYDILWSRCIRLTNRTFVEGFASARKCSNEGRALMQLDFQQFLMKLEKIVDLRPIPDKEYVEAYIKAFYLPENNMEEWIISHKEYSSKQMVALINCVSHINKKARQRLLGIIEEIDRTRK